MFRKAALKTRSRTDADKQVVAHLISRGNAARDAQDWPRAALFYEEALRLAPGRADIHIQHGHMLKESGDVRAAEAAYLAAQALTPDDPDLALQMGHLYKMSSRFEDARNAYERALTLKPKWDVAAGELATLRKPESGPVPLAKGGIGDTLPRDIDASLAAAAAKLAHPASVAALVPSLAPRKPQELLRSYSEGIEVRGMGQHDHSFWGVRRTVRGVEAIRGFCISSLPIEEVQMLLNGSLFYRGPVRGGYPLKFEAHCQDLKKYVFNIWYDFSGLARGRHAFELRLVDAEGETRSWHDEIVIAQPQDSADLPDSDALVDVTGADPHLLEKQIRERPTVVHQAARGLFREEPRNILIQRTDQLGDMVASIPAMQRLRMLFPQARLVGLLTAANAELATSLGLFDEVIIVDFPDDPTERRRLMPLDVQEKLREQLKPYRFDMAIDLAQASVSRDLLRLSGAPFLYGVDGGGFEWLSGAFGLQTRDPRNRLDRIPHSRKTLALIETLGAISRDSFEVIRRAELDRTSLERFGLAADDRYAVLHMGARIEFSRWRHYPVLAALLLERTDLKVVMMTDDKTVRASLPAELAASPRFQLLDERLSFDEFDTFVSFATVLVGNDSGPKHLAALRGTSVVTLHTARINWAEWGQEGVGAIMSRRVPCAGCAIFHDAEDCGKDFACIRDIRPEEVFDAVSVYV